MIIIRLKGGMGNQIFQYAFGRKLAQSIGTDLVMDLSSLLDRSKGKDFVYRDYDLTAFNVKEQFLTQPQLLRTFYRSKSSLVTKVIRKRLNNGRRFVREAHFHYQPSLLQEASDNTIYEGWFQSPRYFEGIEAELRQELTFKHTLLAQSQALLQRIQSTNSVCLNVRRTDFLKVSNLNTTNLDYFLRAAEEIASRVSNPEFFVFSDDVEWCRENIKLAYPVQVVDHSHKGIKFTNYMQLMSACQHFIIPNSSYAWWAVWLNEQPNKIVIAPKNWFTDPKIDTSDLVPKEWLRM